MRPPQLAALAPTSLAPPHPPARGLRPGEEQALYDTDRELLFRQESYFQWAFGVAEPGFYGVLDVARRRSVLFMPRLPPEYAVWMGVIHSPQYFQRKYEVRAVPPPARAGAPSPGVAQVDEVKFTDQLDEFLTQADAAVLYTLKGENSDSGASAREAAFDGVDRFRVDNGRLFPILANLRVIKTPEEIEVLRYAATASSAAHKAVMRQVRPGVKEYQAEATFRNEVRPPAPALAPLFAKPAATVLRAAVGCWQVCGSVR